MADIFLSYARTDRSRIEPIVRCIEQQGWSVWWDPDIDPGRHFHDLIQNEIDKSLCVIVAWSRESIKSRWVFAEAHAGLEDDKLVPLLLDDVRPPILFRPIHTANFRNWTGAPDDHEFRTVLRAIRALSKSPGELRLPSSPEKGAPGHEINFPSPIEHPDRASDLVVVAPIEEAASNVLQFKYKAYITYSHRDSSVAHKLHRDLERFSVPRELVGQQTGRGIIPANLRPIYRERAEFSAGHGLDSHIRAALEASEALIVVCSPSAARSHYVNEEIRLFKNLRPHQPIIPVLGEFDNDGPPDMAFPPALVHEVDETGQITDKRVVTLAADLRRTGDGPRLAIIKIVAGLLDIRLDELLRRAERVRRRQIVRTVAGLMAMFTIVATLLAASVYYRRLALEQQLEMERLRKDLDASRGK